jgi:tetratricopeptide (TPR) repeat protein
MNKMRIQRQPTLNIISWACTALFFLGCRAQLYEREFRRAERAQARGELRLAIEAYKHTISLGPRTPESLKAARALSRIFVNDLKDFSGAIEFFRRVIIESGKTSEKIAAQKEIISILLNHLNDYSQSIIEIQRILPWLSDSNQQALYRLKLARALYQLKDFPQVEKELNLAIGQTENEVISFELRLLLANNFLAQKKPKEAILILKNLESRNPEEFYRQNLGLVLAAAFEENLQVPEAIEVLKKTKERHRFPEFIDLRIKRLEEKRRVVPGARGFRM